MFQRRQIRFSTMAAIFDCFIIGVIAFIVMAAVGAYVPDASLRNFFERYLCGIAGIEILAFLGLKSFYRAYFKIKD